MVFNLIAVYCGYDACMFLVGGIVRGWVCLVCDLVNSVDIVLNTLSLSYSWGGGYSCLFVGLVV